MQSNHCIKSIGDKKNNKKSKKNCTDRDGRHWIRYFCVFFNLRIVQSQRQKLRDCVLQTKVHFLSVFNCIHQTPCWTMFMCGYWTAECPKYFWTQLFHLSEVCWQENWLFRIMSVMKTAQGVCPKMWTDYQG